MLVDQAEEAFALCEDEDERERFFDALVAQTGRGRVVLALRADHTGDLAAHPGAGRPGRAGLFLLGPMSADSLRQAIETPARQHGLVLEPGLTDLLVREIEGEPGALPLLSHALRETWLRHEGRTLTVAGYQASGGVRGAVAQSAESLYGDARRRPSAHSSGTSSCGWSCPGPAANRSAARCRAIRWSSTRRRIGSST